MFHISVVMKLFIHIGFFMHTYIPKPASFDGSITIYEPENIPLSSGNPPGCSPSPLLSFLTYSLRSPHRFFHFDEMTGSTFFFLVSHLSGARSSSSQRSLDSGRLKKKYLKYRTECVNSRNKWFNDDICQERITPSQSCQYAKRHPVSVFCNKLQSTYFQWNWKGEERIEKSKCERKYQAKWLFRRDTQWCVCVCVRWFCMQGWTVAEGTD